MFKKPPLYTDRIPARSSREFRIDSWTIYPNQNIIQQGGRKIRVESRVMEVLNYLAQANNRVVSREELFKQLWPGVIVTEESLTRCISILRKAFGEDPRDPRIIKTVSKRGYQLLVPVKWDSGRRVRKELLIPLVLVFSSALAFLLFRPANKSGSFSDLINPVTSLHGREILPQPAPADERLAFSWDGRTGKNWDIYLRDANGALKQLTDHPGREQGAAWSPDGEQIAYIRNGPKQSGIYITAAKGGESQKLTERKITDYSNLSWSADGKHIAFADSESQTGASSIHILNLRTGERAKLTYPSSSELGHNNPEFSPDSKYLSYVSIANTGTFMLNRITLLEGTTEVLTKFEYPILGHSWSQNGDHILLSLAETEQGVLYRYYPAQDKTVRLGMSGSYPRYSYDESQIIAEHREFNNDIWQLDLRNDPAKIELLIEASSSRNDLGAAISPAGSKLAFASNRLGPYEVFIFNFEDSSVTKVTDIKASYINSLAWSPDGQALVINAFQQGSASKVLVADVTSGKILKTIDDESEKLFPAWSYNGKAILYSVRNKDSWDLWRYELSTGTKEMVAANALWGSMPNATELLYTNYPNERIYRASLTSNDASIQTDNQKSFREHFYRWNDTGIVHFEQHGSEVTFLKSMKGENPTQPISTVTVTGRVQDFDLDEDHQRMVITINARSDSDLIMYSTFSKE